MPTRMAMTCLPPGPRRTTDGHAVSRNNPSGPVDVGERSARAIRPTAPSYCPSTNRARAVRTAWVVPPHESVDPRRLGGGRISLGCVALRQPPILKTLPPHFGQVPERAGLPFFMVIRVGFW